MNDVTVALSGGLGNQLFQLCAGIKLELDNKNVRYDISNLVVRQNSGKGNYTRELEISELINSNKMLVSRIPSHIRPYLQNFQKYFQKKSVIFETNQNENVLLNITNRTKKVFGYFQDIDIVKPSWPILKTKMLNSKRFKELIKIDPVDRIGIHMRFGDYAEDEKTKSIYGLTKPHYYNEAIKKIITTDESVENVLVVTDNILFAKELVESLDEKLHFNFKSSLDPVADLIELSKSSHIVMSNSSFSWWGAWIGSQINDSRVIYPNPWLASDPNLKPHLFDPEWQLLERTF